MEGHESADEYTLKWNLAQLLCLRVTFYTLSLFHLRAYARKKNATEEINLESASQNTGEPTSLNTVVFQISYCSCEVSLPSVPRQRRVGEVAADFCDLIFTLVSLSGAFLCVS